MSTVTAPSHKDGSEPEQTQCQYGIVDPIFGPQSGAWVGGCCADVHCITVKPHPQPPPGGGASPRP